MASKYSKDFKVPKDFPSVLKAFTREVLRSQPANIYEFGADYFTTLLEQLEQARPEALQLSARPKLTPDELERLLQTLFQDADADRSGALSIGEFKRVIEAANIPLSKTELAKVLAEADVNNDGEIDYVEFVPLAVELVQGAFARAEQADASEEAEAAARFDAETFMLHGMNRAELEGMMMQIFQKADADGSGALGLAEFHDCIKEADLGFTRKEVNTLMHSIDLSNDGEVSYAEFVPLCFSLLVEIMKTELMQAQPPSEVEDDLRKLFVGADPEGSGKIPMSTLRDLIKSADFGLTRLQIHMVLAEAAEDMEGYVEYESYVPAMAGLISRLLDVEAAKERKTMREDISGGARVHGCDPDSLARVLRDACEGRDGGGAGVLSRGDLRAVLTSCSLGLSPKEVTALMSSVDADEGGMVAYEPLIDFAFKLLLHLEQQG